MPDPMSRAIDGLLDQLDDLSTRMQEMEAAQRRGSDDQEDDAPDKPPS